MYTHWRPKNEEELAATDFKHTFGICNICGQAPEAHINHNGHIMCSRGYRHIAGPKIPIPRIVPCEWGECGCPGWHVVMGSPNGQVEDDIALQLPTWFTDLGTYMYRMPNTPASWPAGNNCRGRNWLGRRVEAIGNWVTKVSLNKTWVKYYPKRFWVNCHCNGGGELTQALVEAIDPGYHLG